LGEEDLFLRNGASHGLFLDGGLRVNATIANTDRTVGARLSGEIARVFGDQGLPSGSVEATFEGSAGQSFGAFSIRGMRLILYGEANDYVGKGMAGGELVIRPPREARFATHENVIIGNTVLYGATGGTLYAAGRAGERFCVRNSGARAVVEGLGDHGCEYMTGGIVVVLGEVGKNFGAGMTGGIAYVLDEAHLLPERYNPQLVSIERLNTDDEDLSTLLREHLHWTESPRAREVLANWEEFRPKFWRVVPHPSGASVKVAPVRAPEVTAQAQSAP
jgi:glutamate synthase domain-containing protein 3